MPHRGGTAFHVASAVVFSMVVALVACAPAGSGDGSRGGNAVTGGRQPADAQTGSQRRAGSDRARAPRRPAPTAVASPRPPRPGETRLANGRVYVLAAPPPAPADGVRPLLVVLHSFGGDWSRLEQIGRYPALARAENLVVAYGVGRAKSWNAGGCCGWAQSHESDDVGYLVDLVADVRRRVPDVDPDRIYLTGFSNGAMMVLRALCERPDVFAAGVGVAGQLVTRCAGGRPIRYLGIHGTADATVPFLGGKVGWLGLSFPPLPELPRRVDAQAPGSTIKLRIHPCGHVWPTQGQCGIDAAEAGWGFLRRFALDGPGGYRRSRSDDGP